MLELTPELLRELTKSGSTDPIEYYRRPLIGRLFRKRINIGLSLLPGRRYKRALEIGYGAGAVLLAVAPAIDELNGIDLHAEPEPVIRMLRARGHEATLVRGSVYELPYPDTHFDLVVCFSVFEHLHGYAKGLEEVSRVLRPGGLFLLGMPAVNRMMELGFRAIGFKEIEDHHETTPGAVARHFPQAGLRLVDAKTLDFPVPGLRLYYNWLLEKGGG